MCFSPVLSELSQYFPGACAGSACMDDFQHVGDGIRPPCGHVLCNACFEQFAEISLREVPISLVALL